MRNAARLRASAASRVHAVRTIGSKTSRPASASTDSECWTSAWVASGAMPASMERGQRYPAPWGSVAMDRLGGDAVEQHGEPPAVRRGQIAQDPPFNGEHHRGGRIERLPTLLGDLGQHRSAVAFAPDPSNQAVALHPVDQ